MFNNSTAYHNITIVKDSRLPRAYRLLGVIENNSSFIPSIWKNHRRNCGMICAYLYFGFIRCFTFVCSYYIQIAGDEALRKKDGPDCFSRKAAREEATPPLNPTAIFLILFFIVPRQGSNSYFPSVQMSESEGFLQWLLCVFNHFTNSDIQ
jgi:hypothetical protein